MELGKANNQSVQSTSEIHLPQGETSPTNWLMENGPRELELLFRAIVFYPSAPILITDDSGTSLEASIGVGKLLGVRRDKVIGRPVADFIPPASKPEVSQLWRALQEQDEHEGTLCLVGPDAAHRDVAYSTLLKLAKALGVSVDDLADVELDETL